MLRTSGLDLKNPFSMITVRPSVAVRVLGGLAFAAVAALYLALGGSWWAGLLLLFLPDLAFLGVLAGPAVGVAAYNAAHRPLVPALLLLLATLLVSRPIALLMLIWLAHIAMDRAAGYGLKKVEAA